LVIEDNSSVRDFLEDITMSFPRFHPKMKVCRRRQEGFIQRRKLADDGRKVSSKGESLPTMAGRFHPKKKACRQRQEGFIQRRKLADNGRKVSSKVWKFGTHHINKENNVSIITPKIVNHTLKP
jgi:ribosomal protein L34